MGFSQIALQQRSRPYGRAEPVVARIVVDDCVDQRVNDSEHGYGSTGARSIQQTLSQVQFTSVLKRLSPVVNGLPAHIKEFSDFTRRQPLVQSKQCMSAPHHRRIVATVRQCIQLVVFSWTELKWVHKVPPEGGQLHMVCLMSRNFCPPTYRVCRRAIARNGPRTFRHCCGRT